jgi:hypothetical protein
MSFQSLCFLTVGFFVSSLLQAQELAKPFTKELTIITENDNYNFTLRDRYYTNGFFIRFNWLAKKENKSNTLKTIHRAEAGQMIFNSYYNRRSAEQVLTTMDRPYAGWLYASYGQTKIFSNQRVLKYDGMIGVVGPAALGKEVQTGYHRAIRLYKIYGWDYQLKNETGFNASIQYYHPLVKKKPGRQLALHAVGRAMLGNTFTNASAGLLLKIGRSNKEENNAYWSGSLGQQQEKSIHNTEAFFFLEPVFMAQAYNATVQGALFRSDKGLYVSPLNPFLYIIKGGAMISGQRAAFSITYTLKQKEAKSMIDKMEIFGAFAVSYRFR